MSMSSKRLFIDAVLDEYGMNADVLYVWHMDKLGLYGWEVKEKDSPIYFDMASIWYNDALTLGESIGTIVELDEADRKRTPLHIRRKRLFKFQPTPETIEQLETMWGMSLI